MPPFRVEYLCPYRPVWRWDGGEWNSWLLALAEALRVATFGRNVRIVDANDQVVWSA